MNLNTQPETELERRIVAMLFALACLAERAAQASYPVRAVALWLLRRAETVVWDDVVGENRPMAIRTGNGPADALDLAASLRALARAVEKLAARCRRLGRRRQEDAGEADDPERHAAARLRRDATTRRWPPRISPCPDTS